MSWVSIGAGVAVAAFNGLVAWLALRWVWTRPQLVVPVVLGSMTIRLLAVGVVSGLLLAFTSLNAPYYAGALILTFVLIQGLEIAAVLRRSASEQEARNHS